MKLLSSLLTVSGCAALTGLIMNPAIANRPSTLMAQNESCYMVTSSGNTISLGNLCSGEKPTASPSKPVVTKPKNVFQARIKRRDYGTPVIDVVFNGNQTFEMIVDTGATSTLITPRMAEALRVDPVGKVKVSTASAANIEFPVGYVNSVEVDGAVIKRVLVIVGGPEQEIGLLGHDFFGDYDVTFKRDMVEFRYRS